MKSEFARRVRDVQESATLKLNAIAQDLQKKGVKVYNFTTGEPDFPVLEQIEKAVIKALGEKKSKYTPAPGIPELRQAIAERTNAQQKNLSTPWTTQNVIVTNGGKQAIFNAMQALLDEGDEALVISPYWLSYPEMAKLALAKPVIVTTDEKTKYKLTPEVLKSHLNPKTKMLVLNSPSNPAGITYTEKEYQALGKVLADWNQKHSVWIVSDEIYDQILYTGEPFVSFLDACPELQEKTITVNGLSKSAAMTGWRVGWSVAPKEVTQVMNTIQGQSTSGINSLAQYASLEALRLPIQNFTFMRDEFEQRRKVFLEKMSRMPNVRTIEPDGAFYVFADIRGCLKPGESDDSFCERLLQNAKVAVVPGSAFGHAGFIRFSFAISRESIEAGLDAMSAYLAE